jgi:hypothetical protein
MDTMGLDYTRLCILYSVGNNMHEEEQRRCIIFSNEHVFDTLFSAPYLGRIPLAEPILWILP